MWWSGGLEVGYKIVEGDSSSHGMVPILITKKRTRIPCGGLSECALCTGGMGVNPSLSSAGHCVECGAWYAKGEAKVKHLCSILLCAHGSMRCYVAILLLS